MAFFLMQILVVPILALPIVYWSAKRIGAKTGYLSFLTLGYATFLIVAAGALGGLQESYDWGPLGTFGLNADGISLPVLFTIGVLSSFIAVYSIPYMEHRIGENNTEYGLYYVLYHLYSVGMLGTALATNLIEFYLFFELMLIPSYFLIARWGYGERDRISFMYFMWTHVGALAFLTGILAVGYLSAFQFDLIRIDLRFVQADLRLLVASLMVVGLLVKMAAFGLHIWLPYAHAEAPTPISALLSPAMIGIGGYAIVRIVLFLFPSTFSQISLAIAVWALVTMFYGGAMALVQDDIKRLMAYSSVSQMGYILLGIASAQSVGIAGSMFHYFSHGMGKGMLFMVAGAIILQAHGLRSISRLGGLATRMPVTATAALLGFLTLMGVPPSSGFISEVMIFIGTFQSAMRTGFSDFRIVISVLAVTATAVTASYGLLMIKKVFFGAVPQGLGDVKEAPLTVTIPLLALAMLAVIAGIFPDVISASLLTAVRRFLGSL